jgi:hypothetical protein
MYVVQCCRIKQQLTAAAEAAVGALLDVVCGAARDSNARIAEAYAVSLGCWARRSPGLTQHCEASPPSTHTYTRTHTIKQAMSAELGKSCASGEAVLALKRYITRCSLDNEGLKEAIAANKARDEFLAAAR